MKAVVQTCPTCGEKISPKVGECLYCPPPMGSAEPPPSVPTPPPDPERAFGLLLFEAEECLARGHVEKALVHASRAMREQPGSLTARSLFERARKEATRGRRKEKLEAKLAEARRLFEARDFAAAEKIVGAALKLVPDNAVALELFGKLKERRLAGPSAEAEAERDLDRLARERARRSAEAARTALQAGAEFRALLTVRRALRLVPDDPELLAVLAEVQKSLEAVPAAPPAAPPAAVQAAVQEVQRTGLARRAAEPKSVAASVAPPKPVVAPAPAKPAVAPSSSGVHRRPVVPGPPPGATPRPIARPIAVSAGPDVVRLPARPHRTPWPLVIACGGAVVAGILYLGRSENAAPAAGTRPMAVAPPATAGGVVNTPPPEAEGPLARVDPELRRTLQETLTAYGQAIERIDPEALARARPDLSAEQRARLLERFRGALNVATDLRVLDVLPSGDAVVVAVLRTDVVVGGRGGPSRPVEETLHFVRSGSRWALRRR